MACLPKLRFHVGCDWITLINFLSKHHSIRIVLVLALLAVLLGWPAAGAKPLGNGLARTPPMGWNSWNQVQCHDLNEQVVRNAADALAGTGMRDAGYRYVVIDDCWQATTRGPGGALRPDPARFPSGIAALAEYVHGRGLLFGIYAVPGSTTCGMIYNLYPAHGIGSLGHERQDAETFASWGVDYLKYDWCEADIRDGLTRQAAFEKMRDELARLPRPITYAISEYGLSDPWVWARPVANLWRTTLDLMPNWASVASVINEQAAVAKFTGTPGGWNDPDMLQVGNGTLTENENRAHFSMWAILNAPLFAGTDPAKFSAANLATLMNPEVVAVDQDFAGTQGELVAPGVWRKPLSGGGYAVVLLNSGETSRTITASIPGRWRVRDLWLHADLAPATDSVSAAVAPHSAVMFRLSS